MSEPERPPGRLTRRAEFVHVARGWRVHRSAFSLQAARRGAASAEGSPDARIGFTVTKKVGNAVVRNRIRRRMREAVRHCEALPTEPRTDYVVVARREALTIRFETLMADLADAVRRSAQRSGPRKPKGGPGHGPPSRPATAMTRS